MRGKDIKNSLLCVVLFSCILISTGTFVFATENSSSVVDTIEIQDSSSTIILVETDSSELHPSFDEISTGGSENSSLEESSLPIKESSERTETAESTVEIQESESEKQITNTSNFSSEIVDLIEMGRSDSSILEGVHEEIIKLDAGEEGPPQIYDKYVSIKGDYHIWDSFEWKKIRLDCFIKIKHLKLERSIIIPMVLTIYHYMIIKENCSVILMN